MNSTVGIAKVSPTEFKWREWRLREGRYKGYTGPRPAEFPKVIPPAWWARLAAFLAKRKPAKVKPALIAQVIDASHVTGFNELGRAFASQAHVIETRVQLQFGDQGEQEARNLERFVGWAAEWRAQGVKVDGWFRGRSDPSPGPVLTTAPQPVAVDGWAPDYENDIEIAALGELYAKGQYPMVTTLGKRPHFYVPPGTSIMFQSFRESMKSDQSIENCRDYWVAAGYTPDRLIAMIQNYQLSDGKGGIVPWFERPIDQVKTAIRLGIPRVSIYPLNNYITPDTVREIAELLAEAA